MVLFEPGQDTAIDVGVEVVCKLVVLVLVNVVAVETINFAPARFAFGTAAPRVDLR